MMSNDFFVSVNDSARTRFETTVHYHQTSQKKRLLPSFWSEAKVVSMARLIRMVAGDDGQGQVSA